MKKKIIAAVGIGAAAVVLLAGGLGFVITPEMKEAPNAIPDGVKPFSISTGVRSPYYRIPAMITAQDGTVVAAIDARFGGTQDSPNNLDTAIALSVDNGQHWSASQLALSFADWENSASILKASGALKTENSASSIDPCLLQDRETGRIFMIVDAFPYGTGAPSARKGSGYTQVDGQKYLKLCKNGEDAYDYTVRENGAIYDSSGAKTAYSLNSRYEILENGDPLTVRQKELHYWYNLSFGTETDTEVPMNIMYQDALFQPLQTSYLYLIYSDDNGRTWSEPVDLNAQVKPEDSYFMGICPGRGIQIEKGEYTGRLVFAAYYLDPGGEQRFTTIYSDDHGKTWQAGEKVALTDEVQNISETQLVQFPDGGLQSLSRTTAGYVASAYSADGGHTWHNLRLEKELPLTGGSGCQVSAINYQGKIDGKDAVLLSAPAGESRKNGYIYVGLIRESAEDGRPYRIDWTYKKEVTDADTYFAYSCLTQLADGKIGLLYEQANTPQTVDTILFKTFTVQELCETPA